MKKKETLFLSKVRIRAYRSCKNCTLQLNDKLTALVGPNGSGKTNLLQAVTLLRARSVPLSSPPKKSSALRCRIEAEYKLNDKVIYFRSTVYFRQNDANRDDILFESEGWNFKSLTKINEWIEPAALYPIHMHSHQYLRRENKRDKHSVPKQFIPAVKRAYEAVMDLNMRIGYYSASQFTNPSMCATSFEVDKDGGLIDKRRSLDQNRFIYELYSMSKSNNELYHNYMSLVGESGLNLIKRILWRTVKFSSSAYEVRVGGKIVKKQTGKLLIIPKIYVSNSQLSFNQLSEGTFRTLALVFYIVTDTSKLLLIEEPEVCIHHGLLNSIIEVIKNFTSTKQIIFSTHSESVVDQLEPQDLRLVENKARSGTNVSSISATLSDHGYTALKEYLKTTGNLGEYWRHSGFAK